MEEDPPSPVSLGVDPRASAAHAQAPDALPAHQAKRRR
jgi:hypothetical protein